MKKLIFLLGLLILLAGCGSQEYNYYIGFSSTPPEINIKSFIENIEAFDETSSIILFQETAVFEDKFIGKKINDFDFYRNNFTKDNKMFLMIDPLHPTDRRKISNLIEGRSFKDSLIRESYKKLVLGAVSAAKPDYLGLASEINSYQKANPKDFDNFVSLYNELYPEIKAISPETKVFVSFQYEDLQGLWKFNKEDLHPPQWNLLDKFEKLDLFAISTYPQFVFKDINRLPIDYYSQISQYTDLPVAIAEVGYGSKASLSFPGSKEGQSILLEKFEDQLFGENFEFLIWYLYRDYDVQEFKDILEIKQLDSGAVDWFATIGLINPEGESKPAFSTWSRLFKESKKN